LRIQLLGRFRVSVGSQLIPETAWRRRKAAALVKLLALAPEHRLHREEVLELLWPELSPDAAQNNLHRTLHVVRRALEPDLSPGRQSGHLQLQRDVLVLSPGRELEVDADAFIRAAEAANRTQDPARLEAAITLYRGDLLPEDQYEDWAALRREELRRVYHELLRRLSRQYVTHGNQPQAIEVLQLLVASEPAEEDAHRELTRLYELSGRRSDALRQYEQLTEALRQEVDAEPDARSKRLYEDIREDRVPQSGAGDTVSTSRAATAEARTNLPQHLSSFVGRERELGEVKRLLASTRLLTLTGAGGVGKSRLAQQVAGDLLVAYPNGVWLVQLAPVSDSHLVAETVAKTLGMAQQAGRPVMDALVDFLRPKDLLLLLDNCDHLLEDCARLVDVLLSACPHLRVLTTSRQPLHVPGEIVWPVPSLTVSAGETLAQPDEALEHDAVCLFLERAHRVRGDLVLNRETVSPVIQICRQLDGIPLAIELAAARLNVVTVQQLAGRLGDCLATLARDRQAALPHHQTLQATLDWSYELLSEQEQTLFRRLSVFRGGWSLEAAEGICAGERVVPRSVLDLLGELIDKSLVEVEDKGDEMRYRLLEPVRQYATERLTEAGEADQTARKHVEWFLKLAEAGEAGLRGPDQLVWLTRLEGEHDNLRAALAWTLESGEIKLGVALAGAVWFFWRLRGYWQEGRRWLDEVLKRDELGGRPTPGVARARALLGAGHLAVNLSQFEPATRYLTECLRLYRDAVDRFGEARALDVIGSAAKDRLDYPGAYASHEAGLSIMRELGDRWGIASVLGSLARTGVEAGDHAQAVAWGAESAALRRELGDMCGLATVFGDIGQGLYYQGQYARAAEFVTQSLALYRRLDMPVGTAFGLLRLAVLALLQGENERAAPLVAESLALFHRTGVKWGITGGLSGSAWVFSRLGYPERAARLLGADSVFRQGAGLTAGPGDQPILDGTIAEVRGQLQPDRFSELWEQGRSMPLEEAIAESLSVGEVGPQSACGPTESATLTPREREVAALIARGFTNRQIGTALGTSQETARIHVRNILKKLGVASRGEIADWAGEHLLTLAK